MAELKICPLCRQAYVGFPAISRVDNKTEICSDCGTKEALIDFFNMTIEKEKEE